MNMLLSSATLRFKSVKLALALVTATFSSFTMANIVISGTRVIYPESEKEVTVKITNAGQSPVLIQSWIDEGDPDANPDLIKVPFFLTPPMNRVNPSKGQTLRISYTGAALSADRESLFWLNVLEIPPIKTDSPNRLQVAFRTRIKLFFRPKSLDKDAAEEAGKLVWQAQSGGISAKNDAPYYINLLSVHVTHAGRTIKSTASMIAPFSSSDVHFASGGQPSPGDHISYDFINDWGAVKTVESVIK